MYKAPQTLSVIVVVLVVQAFSLAAFATEADLKASEINISVAYVLGALAAIVYKMSVGSFKHLEGKTFRMRALLTPIISAAFLSLPLVLIIMPKFGKPTGSFWTDLIYTYLTTYALIDMTADYFSINEIVRQRFVLSAENDARKSQPPTDEPKAAA